MGAILAASVAPFVVKAGSLMAVRGSGIIRALPLSTVHEYIAFVHPDVETEILRQCGERMALVREMITYGALKGSIQRVRYIPHIRGKVDILQNPQIPMAADFRQGFVVFSGG